MKIEELDLSVRAYHCLKRAGIDTVEQLKMLTDDDLARLRSMGPKCIEEIRQKVGVPSKTNADHIRSMTDEELAIMFAMLRADLTRLDRPVRPYQGRDVNDNYDWLKQPYKEK